MACIPSSLYNEKALVYGVRNVAVVLVKYVCFMYLFKSSPICFGAFHSLIGDLNNKFKLIPRVPMITGFSFPGGKDLLVNESLIRSPLSND